MSFLFFNYSFVPNNTAEEICAEVLRSTPRFVSPSASYENFVIAFIAIYQLYWVITIVIFRYLQSHEVQFRIQPLWLIIFQSFSPIVLIIVGPLRDVTGRENWNCDAYLWFRMFLSPITTIAVLLRVYDFYSRLKLHELIALAKLETLHQVGQEIGQRTNFHSLDDEEAMSKASQSKRPSADTLRNQLKYTSVLWYAAIILLNVTGAVCFNVLIYAIYPYYAKGCTGCMLGPVEFVISSISGWISLPFAMKFLLYLSLKGDSFMFLKEILYTILVASMTYPFIALLGADPWLLLTVTGKISWEWFTFIGCASLHFIPVTMPLIRHFLRKTKFQKIDFNAITDEMLAVIRTKGGMDSFMQHLVAEYSTEHLRFYDEVYHFRLAYNQISAEQRVLMATTIYETFIPDSAFLQINVSGSLRLELTKFFTQPYDVIRDSLTVDVFAKAEKEMVGMLRDAFMRYKQTALYHNFLSNRKTILLVSPGIFSSAIQRSTNDSQLPRKSDM